MTAKNPFDMSNLKDLMDPAKFAEALNPEQMKTFMGMFGEGKFDPASMTADQSERLKGMMEANAEAMESYRTMMSRQGEIFESFMKEAGSIAGDMDMPTSPEAASRNIDTYSKALEAATTLMKQLSDETQSANEKVYAQVTEQMKDVLGALNKK